VSGVPPEADQVSEKVRKKIEGFRNSGIEEFKSSKHRMRIFKSRIFNLLPHALCPMPHALCLDTPAEHLKPDCI
jgi:hypothetical protein